MTITEIWGISVGGLISSVMILKNLESLKGYFKGFIAWKRKKVAKKLQPYFAEVCPAPKYMVEINETLKILLERDSVNREISLKILGDSLKRKARYFCDKGYMPQAEKDEIIEEFLTYDSANGNGKVLYHVSLAMNLPTEEGGNPCDIDMSVIIEREREKYALKHGKKPGFTN